MACLARPGLHSEAIVGFAGRARSQVMTVQSLYCCLFRGILSKKSDAQNMSDRMKEQCSWNGAQEEDSAFYMSGSSFCPRTESFFFMVVNRPVLHVLTFSSLLSQLVTAQHLGRLHAPMTWAKSATRSDCRQHTACAPSLPPHAGLRDIAQQPHADQPRQQLWRKRRDCQTESRRKQHFPCWLGRTSRG